MFRLAMSGHVAFTEREQKAEPRKAYNLCGVISPDNGHGTDYYFRDISMDFLSVWGVNLLTL